MTDHSIHIVSPLTGEYIRLYSDAVEKLLHQGFLEIQIVQSGRLHPQYNCLTVFTNDILFVIMLHCDINTTKSLGLVDSQTVKLLQDEYFWIRKLTENGYMPIITGIKIKNASIYEKIVMAHHTATEIMKESYYRHTIPKQKISMIFLPEIIEKYQINTQEDLTITFILDRSDQRVIVFQNKKLLGQMGKEKAKYHIAKLLCYDD